MSIRRTALCAALMTAALCGGARADDFAVDSPAVDAGMLQWEMRVARSRDGDPAADGDRVVSTSLSYGVGPWLQLSLTGQWERPPAETPSLEQVAPAALLRLTRPGDAWVDLGLSVEYGIAAHKGDPDTVSVGFLAEKGIGPLTTTLNLCFSRDVGPDSESAIFGTYGLDLRYDWAEAFSPGLQFFGDLGKAARPFRHLDRHTHYAGPVATGSVALGESLSLEYEAGYLFGLTRRSPDGAWKAMLNISMAL